MKLIDLYKEWMRKGKITDRLDAVGSGGLCNAVPKYCRHTFYSFYPEEETHGTFWAYPMTFSQQQKRTFEHMAYKLTPLRQTIILLICAMNNEL